MSREEIVRKVAALLRLAARGGTVHEAGAAAARAQELMDKYSIDSAALDEQPASEREEQPERFNDKPEGFIDSTPRWEAWRSHLAAGIASANDCYTWRSYRGRGASIEIVGRPSQVVTVRELYGYLVGEVLAIDAREGVPGDRRMRREPQRGMDIVSARYVVTLAAGQAGPIAQVFDTLRNEHLSTYSRKCYGRDFKRRAQDDADSLNNSDARVAFNAAHDDLLPYMESAEYQRDMED